MYYRYKFPIKAKVINHDDCRQLIFTYETEMCVPCNQDVYEAAKNTVNKLTDRIKNATNFDVMRKVHPPMVVQDIEVFYDENEIYQDTMDFIVLVDKNFTPDVQTTQFVPARDINMKNFEHIQKPMASFVEVEQMFATMGQTQ